jgi:hypothetical protein
MACTGVGAREVSARCQRAAPAPGATLRTADSHVSRLGPGPDLDERRATTPPTPAGGGRWPGEGGGGVRFKV